MMTTTITAQDGTTDTIVPLMMTTWAPAIESGNVVHRLIDGSIAVTLVGDTLRAGEFTLIFIDDVSADAARGILARATSFTLVDTDRPTVNMTFVRNGTLTPAMHDTVKDVWEFTVGYQEVLP